MRHTRAHRDNRRSHHALKGARISKCESCGAAQLRHHACLTCGKYKGKVIIDVQAKIARKEKKTATKKKAATAR